jgi:N-acylneuraminate cytidylyltransferase
VFHYFHGELGGNPVLTAIIPARGGSKGILRKNLQLVGGNTLIARAVDKCRKVADTVYVSSDSQEILAEAHKSGAKLIVRPDPLSTDNAANADAVRHAIESQSITGDILLVQCTAPLVTVDDLRRCVAGRGAADLSVLVHEFQGFLLDVNGKCLNRCLVPPPRRQDVLSQQYIIAGSAWSFPSSYSRCVMYSGEVRPVVCPGPFCDIDTPRDLKVARRLCLDTPPQL